MPVDSLLFADASSDQQDCPLTIFGVPFDGTSTYRPGSRFAPNAMRQASYNFEAYHMDLGVDLQEAHFCDLGNLEEMVRSDVMVREVGEFTRPLAAGSVVTVMLGGEHSITAPCVRAHGRPGYVVLDAHMDFRETYLGDSNSHACVSRRVVEHVGTHRAAFIGVRSYSKEESDDIEDMELRYFSSYEILEDGLEDALEALEELPEEVYLSVDMDVVDPAYAPAVGNPEPFGLTPFHIKQIIGALGERIVGFDVTEVSPPWDEGVTATLGARLVRELIAVLYKAGRV